MDEFVTVAMFAGEGSILYGSVSLALVECSCDSALIS